MFIYQRVLEGTLGSLGYAASCSWTAELSPPAEGAPQLATDPSAKIAAPDQWPECTAHL